MFFTKHMKSLIYENRKVYIIIIFLTIINNFMRMLVPAITGFAVDSVLGSADYNLPTYIQNSINDVGGMDFLKTNIWIIGLAIILVSAVQMTFAFCRGFLVGRTSENISNTIRNRLYWHLQNLPYSEYGNIQSGDVIQRCTSDIETTRRFLADQMMEVFRIVVLVIVAVFFMVQINTILTLSAICVMPFIFIFSIFYSKRIKDSFMKCETTESKLSQTIQENVSGVRVVKAFGREEFELKKFKKYNNKMQENIASFLDTVAYFWAISDSLCFLQYAILIFTGAYLGYKDIITAGEYIMFLNYAVMVIWPVRQLGRIFGDFSKARVSVGRISEILDLELEDLSDDLKPDLSGDIVIDSLSFAYPDSPEIGIIKDLSFVVKKGETVGVLGKTGSGKSSLMHLLLRLYDYDGGSIKINGTELNKINKKYIRENVGIVLQDNFLYAKSIMENLKMANKDIRERDVYNFTKIASIHNTIKNFDEGYNTLVGEKGVTLSGGQKQRTTIARTLMKETPILIFDDSLSAVDTETDLKIRQSLKDNNSGATTFIISQRLTTLMDCNKIVVMEDGKIQCMGTHEELINKDGLYKTIWNIQNLKMDEME